MTDSEIEQEIQAKGKTAPRVTPQLMAEHIASEHYFTARDGAFGAAFLASEGLVEEKGPLSLATLTFCVLVLKNGFTVVGQSAPASPENFDIEIGRSRARMKAIDQLWPLMGYALKDRLHALQLEAEEARQREAVAA